MQTRLDNFLIDKANVLSVSLRLADTIKLQLDTIVKFKLRSSDKIALFEKALSKELEKRHCN